MKPSLLKQALKTTLHANISTFLWGPPGVGKSDIVRQVANDENIDLIDIRAVLLDPVDLRGLPRFTDEGKTESVSYTHLTLPTKA